MTERKNKRFLRFAQVALLCLLAAGVWYYDNVYRPQTEGSSDAASLDLDLDGIDIAAKETSTRSAEKSDAAAIPKARPVDLQATPTAATNPTTTGKAAATTEKVNGYDRLIGTVMVDHRNNDGDSFFVQHGDRQFELRIYYADCPEKYLSDRYEDQRQRVAEQAREMGDGLSIDDTVALGLEAKKHVNDLLEGEAFSVFTKWERVYDGERFYGFVLLPDETEWLSEDLIENGLARIHTKGEPTPDGKSYQAFKKHLQSLESQAKSKHRGAWR